MTAVRLTGGVAGAAGAADTPWPGRGVAPGPPDPRPAPAPGTVLDTARDAPAAELVSAAGRSGARCLARGGPGLGHGDDADTGTKGVIADLAARDASDSSSVTTMMWSSGNEAAREASANGPAAPMAMPMPLAMPASPPRRRRQSFTMRGSIVGISDGLRGSSRGHYALLQALDMLVSMFLMTPAVVSYWRGTWALMDYYVFPDQPNLSNLLSMMIGAVSHIIFTMVRARAA